MDDGPIRAHYEGLLATVPEENRNAWLFEEVVRLAVEGDEGMTLMWQVFAAAMGQTVEALHTTPLEDVVEQVRQERLNLMRLVDERTVEGLARRLSGVREGRHHQVERAKLVRKINRIEEHVAPLTQLGPVQTARLKEILATVE